MNTREAHLASSRRRLPLFLRAELLLLDAEKPQETYGRRQIKRRHLSDPFFENEGSGSDLGEGDDENSDPAYSSSQRGTSRIRLGITSGSGSRRSVRNDSSHVPSTTPLDPSNFSSTVPSSVSPLFSIVTFPISSRLSSFCCSPVLGKPSRRRRRRLFSIAGGFLLL
ncbi:hypothetical protein HPP92_001199 [Vanilla planifolia]|uniref:Uncharacterized protein n=1 Tax=Vanilla planifolia TaxID=51239 RepID=A0A835VJF9_VANPL|nr:hypothetical protein HPP92_001199 [Vanilla planifolia]